MLSLATLDQVPSRVSVLHICYTFTPSVSLRVEAEGGRMSREVEGPSIWNLL